MREVLAWTFLCLHFFAIDNDFFTYIFVCMQYK